MESEYPCQFDYWKMHKSNSQITIPMLRPSLHQLTEMYLSVFILFAVSVELSVAAPTDIHIHLHGIGMAANAGKFY